MMTTTKNSKRKNQPNGVDINLFPKLGAAIDEAVASGEGVRNFVSHGIIRAPDGFTYP